MSAPTKGLLPVFLTVFIDLLGFGIVIPLLPIYAQDHGASQLTLGLLFASFSLMQLIFAPLWGRLSDRIGRKPVLVGGLIGTAGSYVLFGMADTMTMLFVSRALAGFFGANVATAQAWVADVTAPEDRAHGMGIIGAAFGLGFTFGPLIGGEMVGLGTGAPGFAAAGLSAVAAIVGMIRLHEPPRHRGDSSRTYGLRTIAEGLRQPVIGTVLLLYFLGILAFAGFESMFIRFGLERFPETFGLTGSITEATHAQILAAAPIAGRYMFVIGLIAAIIQGGFIRRLVPRFGETRLIVAGPLFLGLSFALLAIAPNWGLVIGACALMPFGFGLNNPALQGLLSRAVPADHQGAFLGLNQSLGSLARVVGPVVAGLLFQFGNAGTPFVAGAGVLFVATFVAFQYHRNFAGRFARRGESA